jgi:hypothetical protein
MVETLRQINIVCQILIPTIKKGQIKKREIV